MRFLLVVSVLVFAYGHCYAQKISKISMKDVSRPEKTWALLHPFVAAKALRVTRKVVKVCDSIRPLNILNVQQLNAVKHGYWMALLSEEIGKRRSLKLAKAHEKGNYIQYKRNRKEDGEVPDKISSEMDMFNNIAGINIAEKNRNTNHHVLLDTTIAAVLNGEMKVIKTNSKGQFLRKDDTIIEPAELSGRWENEKCLVNSNYRSAP